MLVTCIICSDLISAVSEVYTTKCGHVFHYVCLIQWLDRSTTCPQCRHKCTEKTIFRIYLNHRNAEDEVDEGLLQHKLDNAELEIRVKDREVRTCKENNTTLTNQNNGLREEVKKLEKAARISASVTDALKAQLVYFKDKLKKGNALQEEVTRLQEQIKTFECYRTAVKGTRDQVTEMLKHTRQPEQLALLVSSLKKELVDIERKKQQNGVKLIQAQNEICKLKRENTDLVKGNENFRAAAESHKGCEPERRYLKGKIADLEEKLSANNSCYTPDVSLRRIMNESPLPVRPDMNEAQVDIEPESPSIENKAKAINESDSPYITLNPNSLGMSGLMNARFKPAKAAKVSNKVNAIGERINCLKTSLSFAYGGADGYAKEDLFPTPNKAQARKRPKSSATVSANKFRKLSSLNNQKLDSFLK